MYKTVSMMLYRCIYIVKTLRKNNYNDNIKKISNKNVK